MLSNLNDTFIALIPKFVDASAMKDYRPISLCSIAYKIFSKILVFRLKLVLGKMIAPNQKGFVEGRNILDVVILTHEIIPSMEHSKKLGMAFKIDISKAYDRVSWPFLFSILKKFGIDGRFLKMISACVTSMYFFLVNGVP